jgi:hypothetical protein
MRYILEPVVIIYSVLKKSQTILHESLKKKLKVAFMGPIQHCGRMDDCTLTPEIVPSFISRGALHQAARETCTSEGRKLNTQILPATRNLPLLLGSFTCPKVGTYGRLFDFPFEGRHAEDFDVELHLFSRYTGVPARKNVTSHVTSVTRVTSQR